MAIVHRRTFYAKVGQAAPLIQHFQEAEAEMKGYGIGWKTAYTRIITAEGRTAWSWNGS